MALGVISIIIGLLFAINSFFISPTGAPQQTVQYLGFVCSAIFLSCGFILFKLNAINENLDDVKISLEKVFVETAKASSCSAGKETYSETPITKTREQLLNDPTIKNHIEYIRKTKGEEAANERLAELLKG
jgi:hypothetical protein